MSAVVVERAGLQSTLQGAPRRKLRHLGVPMSGPADALSMALANRLVGNACFATAMETTLTGANLRFTAACFFSVTGALADVTLNGRVICLHETIMASEGAVLNIGPAIKGCRNYIAVSGGFEASTFLGSTSTYMPAKFGGHQGRALQARDEIQIGSGAQASLNLETPISLRPRMSNSIALRACATPQFDDLPPSTQSRLFAQPFAASNRSSRMGVELDGPEIDMNARASLPSSAVFPGSLQCPPSGAPFLLLADAQTTGGYAYVLQTIRADLHQLGQIRPGAQVRFLRRTPEQASATLAAKRAILVDWLPDFYL